jgi:hypothetical protein
VISGQGLPAMWGVAGETLQPMRRAERYLDFLRYPFDIDDGPLDELLHAAARDEAPIAEWKRRFIGEPIDDARFAGQLEQVVRGVARPVEIDATRGTTVVGYAEELHERPELLADFTRRVGPDDDVTLVVYGPGYDAALLLDAVQATAAAAGIADDQLPDILLLPLPATPAADRRLAERADAVLSDWPAVGPLAALPRWRPDAHAGAAPLRAA